MTKIIFGLEKIEVVPSEERPSREILQMLSYADALRDNPGIRRQNAERLAGLAADLILRDYDIQSDIDNN